MKTLIQKSTGKYLALPSHFSDVPEIWGDNNIHTLEIIVPDVAANLKIEPSDVEIIDVDVVKTIDWKLIEKELKYLIQNWGVPENDYRGYPDAKDIVRTVKYMINHK